MLFSLLGEIFYTQTSSEFVYDILNEITRPEKNKYLHDLAADEKEEGMGNVHLCKKRAVQLTSVFDYFRVLVFCCHLELFLPLHVAVSSHCTQVASVHCQQHHRGRKSPITDVS